MQIILNNFMAQLIGYTLVNGGTAKDHPYQADVETQADIETHRQALKEDVDKCYNVYFSVRQEKGGRLTP